MPHFFFFRLLQYTMENASSQSGRSPARNATTVASATSHRRKRLVRSENVYCNHFHQGWEAIFRESLLHMAWPISLSISLDNEGIEDCLPLKIR